MTTQVVTAPSDDELDHAWAKRDTAIMSAELSALYHQKRERFFELNDKLTKAASLFLGSAALLKLSDPRWIAWIAIFITFASSLSLVLSFSERSKRHAELARGYREIIAEIVSAGDFEISDLRASAWMGKIRFLDAKEPPALSALVIMCQNEIAVAHNSKIYKQRFLARLFVHFFDMPNSVREENPVT